MLLLHQPEGCTTCRDSAIDVRGELECQIISDFQLERLATAWERLWRSNPSAEIFQQFTWGRGWWQSFGSGFKLCVPVVYERSQASLILPLVERRGTLRFLGSPRSDYSDMLCCHPRPEQLLATALEALEPAVARRGGVKIFAGIELARFRRESEALTNYISTSSLPRRNLFPSHPRPRQSAHSELLRGGQS